VRKELIEYDTLLIKFRDNVRNRKNIDYCILQDSSLDISTIGTTFLLKLRACIERILYILYNVTASTIDYRSLLLFRITKGIPGVEVFDFNANITPQRAAAISTAIDKHIGMTNLFRLYH
jgi:hypothetical protein